MSTPIADDEIEKMASALEAFGDADEWDVRGDFVLRVAARIRADAAKIARLEKVADAARPFGQCQNAIRCTHCNNRKPLLIEALAALDGAKEGA